MPVRTRSVRTFSLVGILGAVHVDPCRLRMEDGKCALYQKCGGNCLVRVVR